MSEEYVEPKTEKTLDETDKKCPSCGGTLEYSAAAHATKCPYCGYEEEVVLEDENITKAAENVLDFSDALQNQDWGTETKTVTCEACGAESIYDSMQISDVCPYCGSNHVMKADNENTIAPGGVVPFKISDKEASELFRTWIKKKWFCPKLAKETAKAKKFNGIYLPYWTFDAETDSHYSGRYGKDRTVGSGDKKRTVTDWYRTSGNYDQFFDDELVQACSNQNEAMLRDLEPFDTEDNKPYKPEYIAGYTAQRYSIALKDAWEKAKSSIQGKIKRAIEKKVRSEERADHVEINNINTDFSGLTYKYLLLPVWNSSYKYKDKVYHFMVNGQTGKVAGKSPISPIKVAFAILAAIVMILIAYQMLN